MKNHRALLLGVYVTANVVAAAMFWSLRELDPDYASIPVPSGGVILAATFGVVLSYFLMMGPIFGILETRRLPEPQPSVKPSRTHEGVGWVILVVQVVFLLFVLTDTSYIAGAASSSSSPLKWVAVLMVPDTLFLVYYGFYRESPLFYPNLSLFIASNVVRGWSSFWLVIIFMETARLVRQNRFRWRIAIIGMGVVVALTPFLQLAKWLVRVAAIGNTGIDVGLIAAFRDTLLSTDLGEAVQATALWGVSRFQHLSSVLGAIQDRVPILAALHGGSAQYFFEEGLPQFTVDRVLGIRGIPDLHSFVPQLMGQAPAGDFVNVFQLGLTGWLWLLPLWAPIYLIYVLALGYAGIWLVKKMGGPELAMDAVWLAWILYLMNGWFGAYISLLQALVIVAVLRTLAARRPSMSAGLNTKAILPNRRPSLQ